MKSLPHIPFVTAGGNVKQGDVVCIIEAMKMMNEVVAHKSGVIKEVLVENEDYVVLDDYGDFPGTQYLSVRGINEFSGILQIPFTIHKADISKKEVELSFYEHEYTGFPLEPIVTIDGETYYIYGVFVFTAGNEYIYID